MPLVVICSICSRAKRQDEGLLPARQRYTGSHIGRTEKVATNQKQPFFILSGVYGFISADESIPYYDHLLATEEVLQLASKIRGQLKECGVRELHFYTKNKTSWKPYQEALCLATEALGVSLFVHEMLEDD